jgi:UPF0755 protein
MSSTNSSLKSLYYLLFLPVFLGIISWQTWIVWSWMLSPVNGEKKDFENTKNEIQLSISSGTASQQIGIELEKTGLIRSVIAWKIWTIWLKINDKNGQFQAGNYQFSTNESLPEIAYKIREGKVMETSFTIPEGWKISQIANYFEFLGYCSADKFIKATRNIPRDKFSWLPEKLLHLEGFLYPDTYVIPTGSFTPEYLINIMLKRFETEALPLYNQAKSNTKFSLFDLVTLGSIVEKEAVIPEEREIIAGVFINRLRIGMPLQTDPTVEYGLGIKQTADRPLTIKEVRTKNSYNTYINSGLPPSPIASPGKASLQAVLTPKKTEYLYFVARYDGTHVFSKTLTDHNRATIQIRQQRRNI